MKIIWHQNTFRTVVELEDRDRKFMRLAIENDHMSEAIGESLLLLDQGEHDKAKERLLQADINEAVLDSKRVEWEAELRGVHCGDCVCVPCSCVKCWAESFAGVNTMVGIGKSELNKIYQAFGVGGSERTLDEAIQVLAEYNPKPWTVNQEIWDANIARWREEARTAHAWLVEYRSAHFPER